MRPLRLLDLFSGVGGFSLGLERSGAFETVGFCEIDPFCRKVLAKHWPEVPIHSDVTTREFQEGEADAICGGFPCQDLSVAGKRAGLSETRSGLYRELVRAVRVVRPRVAILENVADLLRGPPWQPGAWFSEVLGDLAEGGACVEWDCVPAQAIGAPHERDRVWIVAHADSERGQQSPISRQEKRVWLGDGTQRARFAGDAPDFAGEQVGLAGQSRFDGGLAREWPYPDAASDGRRQGRQGRPPDSFARVRDAARRNAADPLGARLAFRWGGSDAAEWHNGRFRQQGGEGNGCSIWPDEPALSRVDDGSANWLDRTRATGNGLVPQIPELIGRAIADSLEATP